MFVQTTPFKLFLKGCLIGVVFLYAGLGCSFHRLPQSFDGLEGTSVKSFPANPEDLRRLYHEVWEMVQAEYLDQTFNGQNWTIWEHRYDKLMQEPQDAYVAIETMLASLNDDYTRFLEPKDMSEQSLQIGSKLYGVGIQIMMRDGRLTVVTTLDDTPAQRAGILPNDVITQINGESTTGLTIYEAVDLIRGPVGTVVRLKLRRTTPKGATMFEVPVARAKIKIQTVFVKPLKNPDIGYLRMNSFLSEDAIREMQQGLSQLKNKKALVIDLRGNSGGLLVNAVEMADLFLGSGDIVAIVGKHHEKIKTFHAYEGEEGEVLKKPLVILVDGGSASASEIVSGALKDHHRAILIGTTTFGKGLVQKINPLSDGSGLNITISKYLTPSGKDIHRKGVKPDIMVPFSKADFDHDRDPQLEAAVRYLVKAAHLKDIPLVAGKREKVS